MAKGLDVGTMNIVCAEMEGENVVFVQQRNAFLELDYSDLTKMMLDNANVQYVIKGDKIYVLGDDAMKFATIFRKNTRRPMKTGILSPEEKEAVPIIKPLVLTLARYSRLKTVHSLFTDLLLFFSDSFNKNFMQRGFHYLKFRDFDFSYRNL